MTGSWQAHCDGSAFPNPGTMGLGVILTAPDGSPYAFSVTGSGRGCNNEAEARAVMLALEEARRLGATSLQLHSDSRVVVDQVTGIGADRIERLEHLFAELRALLASFGEVRVAWIPRHRNSGADALARAAAGLPPKPATRPPKKDRRRAIRVT